MISAAALTPPSEAFFRRSPPASTLDSTSLRSFRAVGWMPSSVAMRISTSLRCRSVKAFSTEDDWSWSRCTRMAAMICGCSLRSRSATAPASIHFRLSMPVTSLPWMMRSISRFALSSPSALRSTLLTYSSVSGTSMCCFSASSVNLSSTCSTRSRGMTFILAMVSPSFCTSLGPRCLKTWAASSSPRDISRIAAFSMLSSSLAMGSSARLGAVRRSGRGFAGDPLAHDHGDRGGVLARQAAGRLELAVLLRRLERRQRAVLGARQGVGVVDDGVELVERGELGGLVLDRLRLGRADRRADGAEDQAQRDDGQGRGHRADAQQVQHPGLLPQRQLLGLGHLGQAERGADDLDRVAALLAEAHRLLNQRGQLVHLFLGQGLGLGLGLVLALGLGVGLDCGQAVVHHHRGVQALDVADRGAGHAHGLVDLEVGDGFLAATAAGDTGL